MKKWNSSNWSKAGTLAGIILILYSGWRYFVLYQDMDRAIIYPLIGVLIIAVSWLYNKNLEHGNRIEEMSEYLADKNLEELESKREGLKEELQEIKEPEQTNQPEETNQPKQIQETEQKEVEDGNKSV